MRLLLDEHHNPEVAVQLRRKHHDVVAVSEEAELVGIRDDLLLETAVDDRRAVVTENADDFIQLHHIWLQRDRLHYGIILTTRERHRLRADALGPLVAALDALLRALPNEDALRGRVLWL